MTRLFAGWLVFQLAQVLSGVPKQFFDPPVGPIVCRAVKTTLADSAHTMFEFADGETNARETLAAFGSGGAPLYMTVQSMESGESTSVSHNVAVRFSLGGVYVRIERPVKDGKIVEDSTLRANRIELTGEEVTKSKHLAEWLWKHRCHQETGDA